MIIIGIDPGMSGAIAILRNAGWMIYDMPTMDVGSKGKVRRRIDIIPIKDIFSRLDGDVVAFIEKSQSMPGQGVASVFGYGVTYGSLIAVLTCYQIPFTEVHPKTWKKEMLEGFDKSSKDIARFRAKQLFPDLSHYFDKKKDEHRAEAVLIAEYGRRKTAKQGGEDEKIK